MHVYGAANLDECNETCDESFSGSWVGVHVHGGMYVLLVVPTLEEFIILPEHFFSTFILIFILRPNLVINIHPTNEKD